MSKNEIDDIFLNSKNYYEENYTCKISINCQYFISLVFVILNIIIFFFFLNFLDLYFMLFNLISCSIYFILFKNLKTVKNKYEKNIHPCKEKIIIKIISGIICAFYMLVILFFFLLLIFGDEKDFDLDDSSSLEGFIVVIKIGLGILILILIVPFIFMLFIFINSFHIN